MSYQKHLIRENFSVKDTLGILNELAVDAIVFLVEENDKLIGSVTDGDFRRGFLKGFDFDTPVREFVQSNPKFIRKGESDIDKLVYFRENNFKVIPILNDQDQVVNVVNFRIHRSYLPLDAVIMAGGRGERLRPLTDSVPKPLLKVGDVPIIEHAIRGLTIFGVDDIWITLGYRGDQIKEYIKEKKREGASIRFIHEEKALGTAGALTLIDDFVHEHFVLMNADLLTDVDFEKMYALFLESEADMVVASIPYEVNVPYAIMETSEGKVLDFLEKPTYRHFANGGIYITHRKHIDLLPSREHCNATDLMKALIKANKKVLIYQHKGYWIDIGKPSDYARAQEDIRLLK